MSASERIAIEPMQVADLPSVMRIEVLSFPTPWPIEAYRHELLSNPLASYFVARLRASDRQPSVSGPRLVPPSDLPGRIAGAGDALGAAAVGGGPASGAAADRPHSSVAGYAGLWAQYDEAHVSTIAVDPRWRGRGVGERLLAHLIALSVARGMAVVTLEVRVSNSVARRLYAKYGFVEVGSRKGYYADTGEDALIMTTPRLDDETWRAGFERLRREEGA